MDTTDFARSLFMLTSDVPITNLFDKEFGKTFPNFLCFSWQDLLNNVY